MAEIVAALKVGGLAIFPTDTVIGLGVAAAYAESPQAIFESKQRANSKPVAWLVGGVDALDVYGQQVPDYARNLAHAFWPGALTLIVKASDEVPETFRAADGSIALRMPSHSNCLELIRQAGPLAASSANLSGEDAPAALTDLNPAFTESSIPVFDDGSVPSGRPSTIVDCTGDTPRVLRQGDIKV